MLSFARNPFAMQSGRDSDGGDAAHTAQALLNRTANRFQKIDPAKSGDLPYRLFRPERAAPPDGSVSAVRYPLIVFLHGAGERGTENERSLIHLVPFVARRDFPADGVFVLVPQCPPGQRWVETDWSLRQHRQPVRPSSPLQAVKSIVDRLAATEAIDGDRIYIMGLSMGGFGVWDALARWPERFAAGISICGGADLATAVRLRHIPIRVYHGERDRTVLPERSRGMVAALRRLGAPVAYTEYAKVGHAAWTPALQEGDLIPWMLAQQRRPTGTSLR